MGVQVQAARLRRDQQRRTNYINMLKAEMACYGTTTALLLLPTYLLPDLLPSPFSSPLYNSGADLLSRL